MKASLGWREWVGLPALGLERIKAKVDTGARTSALHASSVTAFAVEGRPWVRFFVQPLQRSQALAVRCEAPVADRRRVRDSGGREELRYVIKTLLRIGSDERLVEMTLTDRNNMGFRLLVGRTAIRDRYVVDPGRSYLLGGELSKGAQDVAAAGDER